MKLIKILVTMSLLNSLVVMGIVYLSTQSSTPLSTQTPRATVKVAPTGCVIRIDGVSYEITSLRQTHSGGEVFTCGTDMSAIFWGRHNSRILQMMQQYKI